MPSAESHRRARVRARRPMRPPPANAGVPTRRISPAAVPRQGGRQRVNVDSNTRTNVVRRAVAAAPHFVGPRRRPQSDRDSPESRVASSAALLRSMRFHPCRSRDPDLFRPPLRLWGGRHPLRPGPGETFGRPLARRVDAHLAAVRREVAGVLEVVHRPAGELDVALGS